MYTVFFHHIVIASEKNYHNMVKKYCIHMYTKLYNYEALHEITDFVHEMLSVCAPLHGGGTLGQQLNATATKSSDVIFSLKYKQLYMFFFIRIQQL